MYMRSINAEQVRRQIRAKGLCLTEAAVYLLPQYEERTDAYHSFKYWLKVGRMPVAKYEELQQMLQKV